MVEYHQGDILRIEKIKYPVLVVSKDFFNETGEMINISYSKQPQMAALHQAVHRIQA